MYESFFNLSDQPFKLSPDPRFFFGSRSHNKAMAYLHYGLRQAEGFIVITGEIGAGKSILIGHLLDQLDRSNVVAAHLLTPHLKAEDLLSHILSAFNIEPAGEGKTAEIEALEDFLFDQMNRGRRVLLIIDEAQNLSVETLEELRILSNLDYDGTPLFQVFLVGQPEFRGVIGASNMEQLRQRIIASYHLESLNADETTSYIRHRLRVAGWKDDPKISDKAFELIYEATGGLPRKINKLCNRILLFCAIERRHEITGKVVRSVVDDLAQEDVSGAPMRLSPATSEEADEAEAGVAMANGVDHDADDTHAPAAAEPGEPAAASAIVEAATEDAKAPEELAVPEESTVAAVADALPETAEPAPDETEPLGLSSAPDDLAALVADDDAGAEPDTPSLAMAPVAPVANSASESVFDRLRRQRNIEREQSASGRPLMRIDGDSDPAPATMEDVADAIAQIQPLGAAPEPAPEKATMSLSVWRAQVARSIEETRSDLRAAHQSVSKLRLKLDDIEKRRQESQGRLVARLDRAESLLAELRDAHR